MNGNKINRIAAKIDDLYSLYIPLDNEIKNIIKEFIKGNPDFNKNLALLDGNHNTEFVIPLLLYPFNKSQDYLNHVSGDWMKSRFIEEQLTNFFNFVAQKVSKGCQLEEIQNTIINILDTNVQVTLSDILSCNDFMEIFNSTDNDNENKLTQLLDTHKNVTYQEITEAVKSSSLSDKDKKRFFAEVLPKYNFKVCNNFQATWDMFEKGYIDFDTLVTKFWARNDFDKNDQNLDRDGFDKNDQNSDNAFRNFASFYKNCVDRKIDDNSNVTVRPESLNSSVQHMINNLGDKGVIADNDKQNLTNQINSATNVGVVGIIAQFFKNLFSKDKKAFKPIQQTKQDRIISNLKPLSGILRLAAEQQKNAIK